jgi:small subunit ribosomal protein S4
MGDPRKSKKQYKTPAHPWIKTEIDETKILKKEYGLTKRKEILVASSFLKKYKDIAKRLIADKTAQGEKEKTQMMDKLQRYGLLQAGASLDNVLSIQLKDVLERRIQSVLFRKGMCRSMNQARQFITHRHIMIGDKEMTAPSYLLTSEEESKLGFKSNSSLFNVEHPERVSVPKNTAKEIKEEAVALRKKQSFGRGGSGKGGQRGRRESGNRGMGNRMGNRSGGNNSGGNKGESKPEVKRGAK